MSEEDMNKMLESKIPLECDFYYREPTQDPLCPSEVINKKETIKITVSKIIELLGRNECIPKPKELFEKELVEKEISDRVGDIFRQEVFLGKKYFNRELKWFYDFDQMYDCLWAEDLIKRNWNESNIVVSLELSESGKQLYKQLLLNKIKQL